MYKYRKNVKVNLKKARKVHISVNIIDSLICKVSDLTLKCIKFVKVVPEAQTTSASSSSSASLSLLSVIVRRNSVTRRRKPFPLSFDPWRGCTRFLRRWLRFFRAQFADTGLVLSNKPWRLRDAKSRDRGCLDVTTSKTSLRVGLVISRTGGAGKRGTSIRWYYPPGVGSRGSVLCPSLENRPWISPRDHFQRRDAITPCLLKATNSVLRFPVFEEHK